MAQKKSGFNPEVEFNRAIKFQESGRWAEAGAIYQNLLKLFPDHTLVLTNLGSVCFQQGHFEECTRYLEKSLKIDTSQLNAHIILGFCQQKLNRLDRALIAFNKAITLSPAFAELYRYRGNVLRDWNRFEDALRDHQRAIEMKPSSAEAHYDCAVAFKALQQPEKALEHLNIALKLNPRLDAAHTTRGIILHEAKKREEALNALDRAIEINPLSFEALFNRGRILHDLERWEEALEHFDRAIKINPQLADIHNSRGITLNALGHPEDALESFEQAITLNGNYAEAYSNRALVLKTLNKIDDNVLASLDHAISVKPDFAEAHNSRGLILQQLNRLDEAVNSFKTAIRLNPDYAVAYNNIAFLLTSLFRMEEAYEFVSQALLIDPNIAVAYTTRSIVNHYYGRLDEALNDCDKAIELKKNYVDPLWNKAVIKLLMGDFSSGWELYESRWESVLKSSHKKFDQPLWLGETSLDGKRLLIRSEQGLGDNIQFCRYALLAHEMGAKVILQTQKPLVSLMGTLAVPCTIINDEEPLPDFDLHCPVMSLPLAFKTTIESIPSVTPYLFAQPEKTRYWRQRLGEHERLRVGLVWSGSKGHRNDANRSVPLSMLEDIFKLEMEFHVLQKEIHDTDTATLEHLPNVHRHENELSNFADTAGLISEMDIVISVDTSVAHLAGAMNKPLWILLPFLPDYRWMLDRSDTPWYPSARLFRQPSISDWHSVVKALTQQLSTLTTPYANLTSGQIT